MDCPKCEKGLDFSTPEMIILSDESVRVIVISCKNCGESFEAIYSIDDVLDEKGNSIF